MFMLCFWMLFRGKFTSPAGAWSTWAPFVFLGLILHWMHWI
jgi:hypothetical protein